ncbi:MAG: peptidoglycan DD-metalloendopeptidase family protein [Caldilineaceae bacterium]
MFTRILSRGKGQGAGGREQGSSLLTPHSSLLTGLAVLLVCGLWWGCTLVLPPQVALAQANVRAYTVQSGDTLGEIATHFGVSLAALIKLNHITDPSVIEVGQVLLIPSNDAALASVPTMTVQALPGETLALLAKRYAQPPDLLSALNGISETKRLFPGEPIHLPASQVLTPTLHFGAVRQIQAPDQLVQGRTGRLLIHTTRPLSLTADWNGLALPLAAVDAQHQAQFAFLPVPALLDPGSYTLTITYTASSGIPLIHRQPIKVVAGDYEHQDIEMPPEKADLLNPSLVTSETLKVGTVWSQVSQPPWWRTVFTRPISADYPTTSPFGTRRVYNGGALTGFHSGQDFGAPEGVAVVAPAAGVVVLAEPLEVRGNAVIIDHGHGVFTGYWHFSQTVVHVGQPVKQGSLLGLVGTTGLSTGAHLHWEMRIYGVAVNPLQFLDEPLVGVK